MPERPRQKEQFLDLPADEDLATEHLDTQVQKAQEQLVQLKRQQDFIEKQKRELEELSRRQDQLQLGKTEMTEKFTRALVVLEREAYDAQKRVEQVHGVQEAFLQHLAILESINPKNWENMDMNKELTKALSAVDDARTEYARCRSKISAETSEDVLDPALAGSDAYNLGFSSSAEKDFVYWLKSGFAFTLPLLLIGVALLVVLYAHFSSP